MLPHPVKELSVTLGIEGPVFQDPGGDGRLDRVAGHLRVECSLVDLLPWGEQIKPGVEARREPVGEAEPEGLGHAGDVAGCLIEARGIGYPPTEQAEQLGLTDNKLVGSLTRDEPRPGQGPELELA